MSESVDVPPLFEWTDDLSLGGTSLYLDSRRPRATCFISHAHSDHIPSGGAHGFALATPVTAGLTTHRIGSHRVAEVNYHDEFIDEEFCRDARFRLTPAGHVLGSAMLHVTRPRGSLLYTGDFKLRSSLTVEPAKPIPADVLVMETTYGQPFFQFPPWQQTAGQLIESVSAAMNAGRQPIVMGYSLGKAQEIVAILTGAGLRVTCHGAVHAVNQLYEKFGANLGSYRRYRTEEFHGPHALDLAERGVLVAPPRVARSGFVTRFANPFRVVMTGWALLKNSQYRYGVDLALPLSDHADFDELLELVEQVQPKKIYTHHGCKQFIHTLRARGHDATLACPDAQLNLFES